MEVVGQFFFTRRWMILLLFLGDSCLHSKKTLTPPPKKKTVIFLVGRSMPRDDQKMLNFLFPITSRTSDDGKKSSVALGCARDDSE